MAARFPLVVVLAAATAEGIIQKGFSLKWAEGGGGVWKSR